MFQGRIHVADGKVLKTVTPHCHAPSAVQVECAKTITNLKRKASTDKYVPPSLVLRTVVDEISIPCQGALPKTKSLKQQVRRSRMDSSKLIMFIKI